jgi:hypothetical protein
MRKKICANLLVLLIAAALYAGGDPWKTKPYTQWDEKDVAEVLQSSPWVKVDLSGPGALQTSSPIPDSGPAVGGGGGMPNRPNPSTPNTPTQIGGSQGGPLDSAPATYSVFWWSSRTIREAFARRAVLKGSMTQENADKIVASNPDSYQILVNTANMTSYEAGGEDAFKDAALIELKKEKKKISAASVAFQKASGKVVGVIFSFPKKDANGEALIPPDEKQIEFSFRVSGGWLRTSFNLKQMTDMQGQDL